VAALVFLVQLVFVPALNDYLVADSYRVVGEMNFQSALQYFRGTTGFGRNEYRPLIPMTYALDQFFWGSRPLGYHITNVALHVVITVLMFLVFERLTGSLLVAFVSTVLFALQPAHHSRVAWIAARDSLVCLLFLLLSWLLYLHAGESNTQNGSIYDEDSQRRRKWLRFASYGAYFLALLSYEGAVAFPLVLLAMEYLVRAPAGSRRIRAGQAIESCFPFLGITAGYLLWWLVLFRGSVGQYDLLFSLKGMSANFYWLHYRLFYHVQHWLGLAYLAAFLWLWRERKRLGALLRFSIAILWIGYFPYLHVHGYADRFSMLSVIGASLLLGLCASAFTTAWQGTPSARALPLLLLLLFPGYYAWGTGRRLRHWTEAGAKAEKILSDLQQLHPQFPQDVTLVLDRIPTMHENAYVFPIGLRAAIRKRYRQELPDIHYSANDLSPASIRRLSANGPLFHFRYVPERERLVQIDDAVPSQK